MLIKMKHEELSNVKDVMKKDGDLYDEEIKSMLNQIAILRTIWQGDDAKKFCDNAENYFTKMKNIPIALRNMSRFVNNVNKNFTEADEQFARELRTEVGNYNE